MALFGKRYRIAQVDLGTYDHKHADFSTGNPKEGLNRMTEEVVNNISDRYVELYEKVSGKKFIAPSGQNVLERVENNIKKALK